MTILEVLEQYPPDMGLKIGCKASSGFWYVGSIHDFRKNIRMYSGELKSYHKRQTERSREELTTALRNPITPASYARREFNKMEFNLSAEDYMRELDLYFKDLVIKRKTIDKREQAEALYVPIGKREVIDYFEADMAVEINPCLVVLIEGREPGAFWTIDESKNPPEVRCEALGDSLRGPHMEGEEETEEEDEDPDTDVAV